MNSMFDILMGLPLFRGISYERMSEIVGSAKFHFLKYLPGETIIRVGEPCSHVTFIISGSVRLNIVNSDGRFSVGHSLTAPDVIAPDFMFGRATDYPCSVTAIDTVGILRISKKDYINILNSDHIFMFNFLNILSMNAQKAVEGILAVSTGDIRERIAFWISALTQPGGTDIVLQCRQRDLYSLFGVQRSSFISALDSMKADGLIDYTSNEIRIHDRRALLSLLHNHSEGDPAEE